MFGREMRSKLPELWRETVQVPREEVHDCDWSNKLKGKAYADGRRGATPESIRVGDTVLLKAEKPNKLSTKFVRVFSKSLRGLEARSQSVRCVQKNALRIYFFLLILSTSWGILNLKIVYP